MRKLAVLAVVMALGTMLLAGCWSRRELNDISIAVGVGVDKRDGQYEVSVQVVNPQEIAAKRGTQFAPVTMYQETGQTIMGTFRRMTTHSPRKIYLAHLRIMVISEQLAREGIKPILDFFSRDHELRTDFYVVVAKNNRVDRVLAVLRLLEKIPATNLYKILENSEKFWSPTSGVFLDQLISDMITPGRSPVLSGVEVEGDIKESDSLSNLDKTLGNAFLKYSSIGVFRKDKLIGWLNEEESRAFNFIQNKVKRSVGEIACPGGGKLALELIRSKTTIKAVMKNGKPEIEIAIRSEGNVAEVQCDIDLTKLETIAQLERLSNQKLKAMIDKTVHRVQKEYKADIFGFGETINRSHPNVWKEHESDWEEAFAALPVHVKVDFKIRRTGTQTNSYQTEMDKKE
ncbi:Ger(x)C family spore germination protein [Paenibacillus sp. MBLB4367]|uniref:Ger(x)C family spore germination protein n=1 Tax=Paenibacillus sp. MBLB4367 TaxID=3384767 RepID=UPI00390838FB